MTEERDMDFRSMWRHAMASAVTLCAAGLLAISAMQPGTVAARDPDYVSPRTAEDSGLRAVDNRNQVHDLYSQSHALLIGQSQYAHWRPLEAVRSEIDALRAALEESNFRVEVHYDLGSEDLARVIDAFVRTRGAVPDARLFVYFGGHGWTRDVGTRPMGFIVPVDAPEPSQDQRRFMQMALPMTLFEAYARVPDARHMLFVFDSCFSGAFFGNRGATPDLVRENRGPEDSRPASYVFARTTTLGLSRQFLAAGTSRQTVPAKSILVDLLIQVLRGQRPEADVNRDGFVTGQELGLYLTRAVVELTNDANRLNPQFGYLQDQNYNIGDFIFRLPTGEPSPAPAASTSPAVAPIAEYRPTTPPARVAPAGTVLSIPVTSIPPLPATQGGVLSNAQQSTLASIIERLTSPEDRVRRQARPDLSRFLTEIGPELSAKVSANLVRGLAHSSYRYQLGVAVALASFRQQGWRSVEPATTGDLLQRALSSVAGRDPTLRQNLEAARQGLRT
ncbi:hypothetical protein GXW71_12635 [Roseomonas hellenica]|uniref:Caspase family p20 domain-containing protein n=1 Tax=Plastoroseomonas hellenica TaxID=2687306 RepID=A0ABS5EY43_9PROT|nr:caspase family protein [Plastoroseomonas hellenica]MBR0665203.1 hypothetical protein [Plastoroseomonas hellenica]